MASTLQQLSKLVTRYEDTISNLSNLYDDILGIVDFYQNSTLEQLHRDFAPHLLIILAHSSAGSRIFGHGVYSEKATANFLPEWLTLGVQMIDSQVKFLHRALLQKTSLGLLWDLVIRFVEESSFEESTTSKQPKYLDTNFKKATKRKEMELKEQPDHKKARVSVEPTADPSNSAHAPELSNSSSNLQRSQSQLPSATSGSNELSARTATQVPSSLSLLNLSSSAVTATIPFSLGGIVSFASPAPPSPSRPTLFTPRQILSRFSRIPLLRSSPEPHVLCQNLSLPFYNLPNGRRFPRRAEMKVAGIEAEAEQTRAQRIGMRECEWQGITINIRGYDAPKACSRCLNLPHSHTLSGAPCRVYCGINGWVVTGCGACAYDGVGSSCELVGEPMEMMQHGVGGEARGGGARPGYEVLFPGEYGVVGVSVGGSTVENPRARGREVRKWKKERLLGNPDANGKNRKDQLTKKLCVGSGSAATETGKSAPAPASTIPETNSKLPVSTPVEPNVQMESRTPSRTRLRDDDRVRGTACGMDGKRNGGMASGAIEKGGLVPKVTNWEMYGKASVVIPVEPDVEVGRFGDGLGTPGGGARREEINLGVCVVSETGRREAKQARLEIKEKALASVLLSVKPNAEIQNGADVVGLGDSEEGGPTSKEQDSVMLELKRLGPRGTHGDDNSKRPLVLSGEPNVETERCDHVGETGSGMEGKNAGVTDGDGDLNNASVDALRAVERESDLVSWLEELLENTFGDGPKYD